MKRRKRLKARQVRHPKRKLAKVSEDSLASAAEGKRVLFIDPASISTGWALYKGKELVTHGTVRADKSWNVFARMHVIWATYRDLPLLGIDEVHIEQLPRMCHHFTHWSVGVIGHALYKFCPKIESDVPVKAWQKASGWDGKQGDKYASMGPTPLHTPASEDERAAIAMGFYYVNK